MSSVIKSRSCQITWPQRSRVLPQNNNGVRPRSSSQEFNRCTFVCQSLLSTLSTAWLEFWLKHFNSNEKRIQNWSFLMFFFFFLPFTIGRLHQARRRNSVTELFFDYFTTFYFLHSDVVALYMDILFNNLQSFIYSMYRITPLYNNRRACSFLSIDDVHSNAPFLFKAPNKWQLCSFHLESLLNRLVFVSCTSLKN